MVYQLYDSAFRILDIRNNLLENFTGSRKQIIDLAASTIPSSYLLPELLAGLAEYILMYISIPGRQTVPALLTVYWMGP